MPELAISFEEEGKIRVGGETGFIPELVLRDFA